MHGEGYRVREVQGERGAQWEGYRVGYRGKGVQSEGWMVRGVDSERGTE